MQIDASAVKIAVKPPRSLRPRRFEFVLCSRVMARHVDPHKLISTVQQHGKLGQDHGGRAPHIITVGKKGGHEDHLPT